MKPINRIIGFVCPIACCTLLSISDAAAGEQLPPERGTELQQRIDAVSAMQTYPNRTDGITGLSDYEPADLTSFTFEDYASMQLPPLHVLLENARNNPQVRFYNANKEQEERELKSIRREWLRYVKLNANYSYGLTDVYNAAFYNADGGYIPGVYNGREQSYWNIGASLSMPLETIFNRRNKIKQQKTRIESIQFEVDRWYDELSLEIIDAYTEATENMALLRHAAGNMIHAQAQYAVSESDFVNGRIDAQMLARQKSIENSAVREYEQNRSRLNNALLRLEVLTKTPIINRKKAK